MGTAATEGLPTGAEKTTISWRARAPRTRSAAAAVGLVFAVSLAGLTGYAQQQLSTAAATADATTPPVYLPDANFLRLVSLGYENALADFLWFRTINYFGIHYRSDRLYPWLARMCDLITDLDPRAEYVYEFGGLVLPWEAHSPDAGIALLHKGIRAFPASWHLHFVLGFNYFFFKNNLDQALPHIRRASELPGADPFVSRFAATLYSERRGPEMTRQFLRELERTAGEATRAVIGHRLKELRLVGDIDTIDKAVTGYRERFGHLPRRLPELVREGFLDAIPAEPFGGRYAYDPRTGTVASSLGRKGMRLHESPIRKKVLGLASKEG